MQKIFTILTVIVAMAVASCGGSGSQKSGQKDTAVVAVDSLAYPVIEFDTAVFDFGKILQGEQVGTTFAFRNTGNANLIISKVETSCGCTVPEYDRAPVAPGQTGTIRVRFDSDGKEGAQYKTVKVISNCKDNIFELVLKGRVEVKD